MARIAGVNVPENKHIEISLTHIFGIGRKTAQNICAELKIDYTRKISDLSEEEIENIRNAIGKYVVEGDLRRNISTNIKRLQDFMEECYDKEGQIIAHDYEKCHPKSKCKSFTKCKDL